MGKIALGKSGILTDIRGVKIPVMYNCVMMPDVTFEFDKSYIRSKYAAQIDEDIRKLKSKSPASARLIIFGHTDTVGGLDYNKRLSNRRSQSLVNFLAHEADKWVHLHKEEKWGVKIVFETVSALDPSKMKLPVNAYVTKRGDIKDPKLLERLYKDYMEQSISNRLDAEKDFCHKKTCIGCSALNPVVEESKSTDKPIRDRENEPNRRAVVFAVEENAVFPCSVTSMAPCRKLRYQPPAKGSALFTCEFYDRMIQNGQCPEEKNPPIKPKPQPPAPQPSKSIAVYLGFPACTVDVKIMTKQKHDPVLWTKMLEVLEVKAHGRVVAYLREELEDAEKERRGKPSSSVHDATFLVKTVLSHDGTNYALKAEVIDRDTEEILFFASVKAPRLIGVEGYWERSGKYVWRHVQDGKSPRPGYETKYLEGLGIDSYRNDLMLMLCVDTQSGWKEYPNITKRVEAIMQARGYKIVN